MTDIHSHPGLRAVARALDAADVDAVREALLALDDEGQELLAARLGSRDVDRLFQRARRRRGKPRGRVVVIHGIMGSRLESVDEDGDGDRIWLNYWRLLQGRIAELELGPNDAPARPDLRVKVGSLFPEYLPLITELGEQWEVLPFAFDWRIDVDKSAALLAERVRAWANGEPAHVVAHSMGGLVARRFAQLHPDVWRSLQDQSGQGRGGRLVMLGTPNRGSFAIPQVLTGVERTVRLLATLDMSHDLDELLRILGTFTGSYQMLPFPDPAASDDRVRLYEAASYGSTRAARGRRTNAVRPALLRRGREFQEAMQAVLDPERLVYVAGCDQPTPHRVRIASPGEFLYQETADGDGRVPHELGLLPDVRTFWIREVHGDLPRNERVLEAVHELLLHGHTTALAAERPARRRAAAAVDEGTWKRGEELDLPADELLAAVLKPFPRGRKAAAGSRPRAANGPASNGDPLRADGAEADVAAARAEALIASAWVGTPRDATAAAATRSEPVELAVEVVWGDLTAVDGDVYAVGHYRNVLPQGAEAALDRAVSAADVPADQRVLTALTKRGVLRGELGEVAFFPWAAKPQRLAAVAGMGHPGAFGRSELRRLARSLTWAVTSLPNARTICTVLIGSGEGNLDVPLAVEGWILGIVEALEMATSPARVPIAKLRFVERQLDKAHELHAALARLRELPAVRERLTMRLAAGVREGAGGQVGGEHCLALLLGAAASAAGAAASSPPARALKTLIGSVGRVGSVGDGSTGSAGSAGGVGRLEPFAAEVDRVLDELRAAANGAAGAKPAAGTKTTAGAKAAGGVNAAAGALAIARRLTVRIREAAPPAAAHGGAAEQPVRVSFVRDGGTFRAAALSRSAVVQERALGVDPELIEEVVEQMRDPAPARVTELSQLLARLIVPRDFRDFLSRDEPLVFEVDRAMARVPWEMLDDLDVTNGNQPAALRRPVARQLRTSYSPAPMLERPSGSRLRALVIGDPGDPAAGDGLPGARQEAVEVAALLRRKDVEVVLMIGAPSVPRRGALRGVPPASRLQVLGELMQGGFDLLHYAGHGDFDPERPDTTGWVFEGGLLTSRELERVDLVPPLVVANACLSALASERLRSGRRGDAATHRRTKGATDADLLPGLADEFFRRGVRNYVGTAWEVNDVGAVQCALTFYDALLPEPGSPAGEAQSIGAALLAARRELARQQVKFGALWAAYQHYGDPAHVVVATAEPAAAKGGKRKPARARDK